MLALVLLAAVVFVQAAAPPGRQPKVTETAPADRRRDTPDISDIFAFTNQARASQGLEPLAWDDALADAAHAHALRMAAASGPLSHRYPGEADLGTRAAASGAHFSSIAENIAEGVSAKQIEDAWMRSVPHRTNIFDPRMNALGISIVTAGATLYAVEDFAAATPQLTVAEVEQRVAAELKSLAPLVIDTKHTDEARRICAHSDDAGAGRSAYTVTWQGTDPRVPPALADAVRAGKYPSATVGACPAADGAFTVYRITVMLQ